MDRTVREYRCFQIWCSKNETSNKLLRWSWQFAKVQSFTTSSQVTKPIGNNLSTSSHLSFCDHGTIRFNILLDLVARSTWSAHAVVLRTCTATNKAYCLYPSYVSSRVSLIKQFQVEKHLAVAGNGHTHKKEQDDAATATATARNMGE